MPPKPSELEQLAARCEAAEGPDRELDIAIALALSTYRYGDRVGRYYNAGPKYEGGLDCIGFVTHDESERIEPGNAPDMLVPEFTASLDAALTLVPEGWAVLLATSLAGSVCDVHTKPLGKEGEWPAHSRAATPALVLCAAALRAWSA